MTGFRQLLDDKEIAAVLTYVRNSWSNRAKPIDAAKVASVREETRENATFWYAANLLSEYPLEDGSVAIEGSDPGDGWKPTTLTKWTFDDFKATELTAEVRSFETGKLFFKRLGCSQCHKLGGEGGVFGPNLAELDRKKRNPDYILRSIIDPSKDIDKEFEMRQFLLDSGKVVSGLVIADKPDEYLVITDPLAPNKPTSVKKDEIEDEGKTKSSIMPVGLLNWLSREEALDLWAYVLSGGDKEHALYSP
jgi:putative heme-binding domain-containing protein